MKRTITLLAVLLITGALNAQVAVPEATKSLYNKKTASWCPPCGEWGWTSNEVIENGIGSKAVSFKLSASSSGSLYNLVCSDLYDAYDNQGYSGWPNFFVNGFNYTEYVGAGISPSTTESNCISAVNSYYNATAADINAGYSVTLSGGNINVDVTTKFFNEMTGDFNTAIYVLENGIQYSQDGITGLAIGNHILRGTMVGGSFGTQVGTGTTAAGTEVSNSYSMPLSASWDPSNLAVITVIWKDLGGGAFEFVNANDVYPQVGVNEIAQNEVSIYPNPTSSIINVKSDNILNENINVSNSLGQRVMSIETNSSSISIDLSNLDNGVYFVEITSNENVTSVKRVIKQ
jgi:hypothetical protein